MNLRAAMEIVDYLHATITKAYARITVTRRPPGVAAVVEVVRWLMGGCPLRWSKITSQPLGKPKPLR